MRTLFIIIFLFFSSVSSFSQNKYNSLCWMIYDNGLSDTSYLYGTMHIQDARVFQFKNGVKEAFDQSDIFAMELNMDSVNTLQLMDKLIMEPPYRLDSLLTKKEYENQIKNSVIFDWGDNSSTKKFVKFFFETIQRILSNYIACITFT